MRSNNNRFFNDMKVVSSIIIVLLLVSYFYYLEVYGAVLAAVYGMGAVEVYERTSLGLRIKGFIRGRRKE